ncbi:MAG: hypothetical protein NTV46_05410 [Verrucomicrobia bacterium]|nr:hypothetical protein [Verrucomicrobiota bacterium]
MLEAGILRTHQPHDHTKVARGITRVHPDARSGSIPGHPDTSTTTIYLHVLKRPGAGAPSPLDFA